MRRLQTGILMFAVALAIVPLPARAQSGVLIGMATDSDPDGGERESEREKAPAFRTVWIAHDAASARRLTTIPALVVPIAASPASSKMRADAASQALGRTRVRAPRWSSRNRSARVLSSPRELSVTAPDAKARRHAGDLPRFLNPG